MDCIERSKLQLRPHQAKAIRYLFNNQEDIDGLLLVHPPGTGKNINGCHCFTMFLRYGSRTPSYFCWTVQFDHQFS